ncbi:LuxR family two component transcriptional regulator [Haloactinospora alba]|uniref:LuxR family two component transcriptional regulator n=1 Tax=Haloactinospora alba TaxID=405555 RepID=A0A543NNA5_9ACTN|nr:response regulator transcription factor [Haloactinospora alba]TQN33277.1 LuxR family two component transcriptional regulator [Haloactinospora alba]
MIRVMLADDESMFRAGMRSILSSQPDIEVVAEAGDGAEAITAARRYRPDIALLDVRMPGVDGLQATATIRAELPGTAVVMLTTFSDDAYIARALTGGASGFVLKTGDPRALLGGLRAVADGGAYLSPEVAHRVITELTTSGAASSMSRGSAARDRVAELSEREREVLSLIGEGLSNAQIARRLSIAPGTAKIHASAVLTRLDAQNRVQAAILAYEAGLVDRG